jgi:hypothetical protein
MYLINNKSNWIALKRKILLTYPAITEDDLELNDSSELNLLIRLQKNYQRHRAK